MSKFDEIIRIYSDDELDFEIMNDSDQLSGLIVKKDEVLFVENARQGADEPMALKPKNDQPTESYLIKYRNLPTANKSADIGHLQPQLTSDDEESLSFSQKEEVLPIDSAIPRRQAINWDLFKRSNSSYNRICAKANPANLAKHRLVEDQLFISAKALLREYVTSSSGLSWFLHPNRHHERAVLQVLTRCDSRHNSIKNVDELLEAIKAIKDIKSTGSLGRRIAFIEEKIEESHVVDSAYR